MEVLLENIQSIYGKVSFDFGQSGLYQMAGDNSNGKSILGRAYDFVAKVEIRSDEDRLPMINDNAKYGVIIMRDRGMVLYEYIHRNLSECYLMFQREGEDKIIRYANEGGWRELVRAFGLRTYMDDAVCLQVFETYGQLPFVNTPQKGNFEMVQDITTDPIAQAFVDNYKTVTLPKAREMLKELQSEYTKSVSIRDSLIAYDWRAYEAVHERLKKLFKSLDHARVLELNPLCIPPNTELYDLLDCCMEPLEVPPNTITYNLLDSRIEPLVVPPKIEISGLLDSRLSPLPLVKNYELLEIQGLKPLEQEIERINAFTEGICPTCGRRLTEEDCEHD